MLRSCCAARVTRRLRQRKVRLVPERACDSCAGRLPRLQDQVTVVGYPIGATGLHSSFILPSVHSQVTDKCKVWQLKRSSHRHRRVLMTTHALLCRGRHHFGDFRGSFPHRDDAVRPCAPIAPTLLLPTCSLLSRRAVFFKLLQLNLNLESPSPLTEPDLITSAASSHARALQTAEASSWAFRSTPPSTAATPAGPSSPDRASASESPSSLSSTRTPTGSDTSFRRL